MERSPDQLSKDRRTGGSVRLWVVFAVGAFVAVAAGTVVFTPSASHDAMWVHGMFLAGLTLLLLSTIRLIVDWTDLEDHHNEFRLPGRAERGSTDRR